MTSFPKWMAVFAVLPFAPALASGHLNCSAYAGIAVAQQEQNLSLGCGFSGGAWSDNFQSHFAWCNQDSTQMSHLTTGDNARKAALAECIARPQLAQEACIEYAQNAIVADGMARDAECGLGGGAWGNDFAGHFSWCVGASQASRDAESAARSNQLAGCLAVRQSIRETECSGYAQTALIQHQENLDRNCGFTGGRWSFDAATHYNWCLSVDAAATAFEANARNVSLSTQCLVTTCWTETRAVAGIPPWEVVRRCKTQ